MKSLAWLAAAAPLAWSSAFAQSAPVAPATSTPAAPAASSSPPSPSGEAGSAPSTEAPAASTEALPTLPPPPSTGPIPISTGYAEPPPPPPPPPPGAYVVAPPRLPGEYLHDGFYVRLGIGWSYGWFLGSGPVGSVNSSGDGVGLLAAVGGTVIPGLVLAGTLMAQTGQGPPTAASPGSTTFASETILGVLADWYPSPTQGWHVGGSLGLGIVGMNGQSSDSTTSGVGLGLSAMGGYDWWIGPQWSLGVLGVLSTATPAHLLDNVGEDTGYHLTPVTFAIEGTILYQ